MGMSKAIDVAPRVLVLAVVTFALALALLVLAQPAGAYSGFKHATAQSCASCHPGGNTSVTPTDANCTSCHTGGFQSRQVGATTARTCWTCHDPGQDMTNVQATGCGTAAAGAGCHNTASPHYGSNTVTCTTCHGVAQSATNPGTSAHHDQTAYTAPTTCADCHTQAKGLHADFVAGVTCTTCHDGFGTAHPDPLAMKFPTVALTAKPLIVKYGLTTILSGSVKSGTAGVAGKTVTLQQKPVGSADFVTVTQTTTGLDGAYAFVAQSPTMLTTYRIVSQGAVVNATVVKPALKALDVKVSPALTVALAKTSFLLGGKQTIKGTIAPARPGGVVKLTIQRKISGVWKAAVPVKSAALQTGTGYTTYSFIYKPLARGSYRVKASIAATTQLAAFTTAYKTWVVK